MSPEEMQQAEDSAANGLGFLAADFVTEPETWPVFQAWVRSKCQGHAFPVDQLEIVKILVTNLMERQ